MIERLLYLNLGLHRCSVGCWAAGRRVASVTAGTLARSRGRWLAEVELALNRHLIFIRTLVVLCPGWGAGYSDRHDRRIRCAGCGQPL